MELILLEVFILVIVVLVGAKLIQPLVARALEKLSPSTEILPMARTLQQRPPEPREHEAAPASENQPLPRTRSASTGPVEAYLKNHPDPPSRDGLDGKEGT